ncbi:MAG: hypothetical protein ACTHQM_03170 [Thermoanaerobaculia bacterium]
MIEIVPSCARIAPRLEVMHIGDVPVTAMRGFVVVERLMRAERNLVVRGRELEIRGRIEHRVSAENDERLDRARVHVGNELFERFRLIDRRDFDRVGDEHRRADVAELRVDDVRVRMDDRRLFIADDDDARATIRLQVFDRRGDDGIVRLARHQCARHLDDLRGLHANAMIRDGAGVADAGLDRVEAIHRLRFVRAHFAARHEVARVAQVARSFIEEVGANRDDDICLREVVVGVDVAAECDAGTFAHVVAIDRFPLMPLHARVLREQRLHLRAE